MLAKIDATIADGNRALILSLTKKSSEEITNFMLSK
jgi:excinuclease UvrABC helicase subunit UvrB